MEAETHELGWDATYLHLDVIREADWRSAVELAETKYGKLDVLVNNAGVFHHESIEDTSADEWDRIMAVNVKGVFLGTKCSIAAMRRAGGGSIVNISSAAGLVGGHVSSAAYSASKGAVRLFTKATVSMPVTRSGAIPCIQGPSIPPCYTPSYPIWPAARSGRPLCPLAGLGRLMTSPTASFTWPPMSRPYVTGAELVIDGGRTAQ